MSEGIITVPPCDKCGSVQTELGGIEYGPPRAIDGLPGMWCRKLGDLEYGPPRAIDGLPGMWCRKLHVCIKCTAAPHTKEVRGE